MSAKRKDLPAPDTDVLSRRFSLGGPPTDSQLPTADVAPSSTRSSSSTSRNEPVGMVRKTYYYAEDAADALADAVDRIHYDSRGRIPKHVALAEIIRAGVLRADEIATRLQSNSSDT